MGMVVRSNIMAMNANRQLGMNNGKVGNSLEKLASGFRINRAGDDASGLAISEKMKAQIKGLETASANSQDGISLVQTAEGALTEVHDMLNRMVELAGKSANGTMDDNVDRAALEKEMTSLKEEIDRIAKGTNFNGIMLLNGNLGETVSMSGSIAGIDVKDMPDTVKSIEFKYVDKTGGGSGETDPDGVAAAFDAGSGKLTVTYTSAQDGGTASKTLADITAAIQGAHATLAGATVSGTWANTDAHADVAAVETQKFGGNLVLQVGDTADDYNKVKVGIEDMSTVGLGIDTISVADQDSASAALKLLKNTDNTNHYGAINRVSSTRADLGALQNKLEHTINNLDVAAENMSAANSRIRDTDMAKEIMEYTKMNVLTQAAQAMLAQANQQPQNVLQLLR